MEISIQTEGSVGAIPTRIGNVYLVKGGRGMAKGHMHVLIAMTEPREYAGISCIMLTVDKDGKPVGSTNYALHYVEDLQPIAFVEGLEDLTLVMRSL